MTNVREVALLVQAIQQLFACDEAAYVLRLLFIPSADCTCQPVSRAAQNSNVNVMILNLPSLTYPI